MCIGAPNLPLRLAAAKTRRAPVAKLVISSDLWKELQVGTQYQY